MIDVERGISPRRTVDGNHPLVCSIELHTSTTRPDGEETIPDLLVTLSIRIWWETHRSLEQRTPVAITGHDAGRSGKSACLKAGDVCEFPTTKGASRILLQSGRRSSCVSSVTRW